MGRAEHHIKLLAVQARGRLRHLCRLQHARLFQQKLACRSERELLKHWGIPSEGTEGRTQSANVSFGQDTWHSQHRTGLECWYVRYWSRRSLTSLFLKFAIVLRVCWWLAAQRRGSPTGLKSQLPVSYSVLERQTTPVKSLSSRSVEETEYLWMQSWGVGRFFCGTLGSLSECKIAAGSAEALPSWWFIKDKWIKGHLD